MAKKQSTKEPREFLDETVVRALELHGSYEVPKLTRRLPTAKRRLVVGSGNALPTGRIIFRDEDAVYADEGQYRHVLDRTGAIGGAVVISASGSKHAVGIVDHLTRRKLSTFLLTCNSGSRAGRLLARRQDAKHVIETRSRREPHTYNTSTYMGMMLTRTGECPQNILAFLRSRLTDRRLARLTKEYRAFYLMVHPRFDAHREMFLTKFDELFGPMLNGRCFTTEQTKHAKTVVPSERELFISFGFVNRVFGHPKARLYVPLPEDVGDAAMLAVGYYVIGKIQRLHPRWFFDHIDRYKQRQPELMKVRFRFGFDPDARGDRGRKTPKKKARK